MTFRFLQTALIVAAIVLDSVAQGVVKIAVGDQGSFFNPNSVIAHQGDIVRFTFSAATHGVVQSSFEKPCEPLPGGFSSGVIRANDTNNVVWDLIVTNITETIWFYCPLMMPQPHCPTGMVGAINPSGPSVMEAFTNAAKIFSGTPASPSRTLSGVGAFASAPPVTSVDPSATSHTAVNTAALVPSDVPSKSSTTETSPTASPANPPSQSSNHTAAIAGGVVGGSIGLILLFLLIFCCVRRRRNRNRLDQTVETHYFPATSLPSTSMSETFSGKQEYTPPPTGAFNSNFRPSQEELRGGNINMASTYTRAQIPELQHVTHKSSKGKIYMAPSQHPYAAPELFNNNNNNNNSEGVTDNQEGINALAREVAAVLLREQSSNQTLKTSGKQRDLGSANASPRGPPPDYKSRSAVA